MSTISDHIIYRRVAPILLVFTLVLAIAAAAGTYVNDRANARQDREAIETNTENARTACLNANETREGNRALWHFLFSLNQDATPREQEIIERVQAWIDQLYAERDCDDLSRKYPLPPPPTIPAQGPET